MDRDRNDCACHHPSDTWNLCRVKSFGDKHLTQDEIEDFHLSTLKLHYDEALAEYEKCSSTRLEGKNDAYRNPFRYTWTIKAGSD